MTNKMVKTEDGLVLKVSFDDEQIEALKKYIEECFKDLEMSFHVKSEEEDELCRHYY